MEMQTFLPAEQNPQVRDASKVEVQTFLPEEQAPRVRDASKMSQVRVPANQTPRTRDASNLLQVMVPVNQIARTRDANNLVQKLLPEKQTPQARETSKLEVQTFLPEEQAPRARDASKLVQTFLPEEQAPRARDASKLMPTLLPAEPTPRAKDSPADRELEMTAALTVEFNPFSERKVENPISDMDTLTHLLRASLGTGFLAMPKAFKNVGLFLGIVFTILVAAVYTHCAYILVKCSHILYKKTKKTQMTYAEVGQAALDQGPRELRSWANKFRICILVCLFVTYFGTSSAYVLFVAKTMAQVVSYYTDIPEANIDIRIFIVALLLPLIFLSWVRDLKYLTPVSMISNMFMTLGFGISLYYLVSVGELQTDKIRPMLFKPPSEWLEFFSITVFAMDCIGVIMPLENAMPDSRSMLGFRGVLSKGMSGVTVVYILLGVFGYLCNGETDKDAITLDMDIAQIHAQFVKIAIAIAIYCTYGLQLYVCIEILWNSIKDAFKAQPIIIVFIMRTGMVIVTLMLAVEVPAIASLMEFIRGLCFSVLGLIAPAFIEVLTHWDIDFGATKYIIWKNILVVVFGFLLLIFVTTEALVKLTHNR